jgi:hypothetical protein
MHTRHFRGDAADIATADETRHQTAQDAAQGPRHAFTAAHDTHASRRIAEHRRDAFRSSTRGRRDWEDWDEDVCALRDDAECAQHCKPRGLCKWEAASGNGRTLHRAVRIFFLFLFRVRRCWGFLVYRENKAESWHQNVRRTALHSFHSHHI